MPRYRGVLTLEDSGPETPSIHLFDYSGNEGRDPPRPGYYRKQLIALESSIYLGRLSLAEIKRRKKKREEQEEEEEEKVKEGMAAKEKGSDNSESTEYSTQISVANKTNQEQQNQKASNGKKEEEEEEKKVEKERNEEKGEKNGKVVKEKVYLKEGQEFEAYVLKCPNGPYDYAMKVWDKGRASPSDSSYPKEGEEQREAVVVDRNGDFLTVACGPNVAFARRKTFLCSGVDPDDLSLPFARLTVSLRRLKEREAEVPAAAWEAILTQIVVPYDVY